MKRALRAAVVFLLAACVVVVGYRAWWRPFSLARRFNALEYGTTKAEVYARLGDPDRVEACTSAFSWDPTVPSAGTQLAGCMELSYSGYLERWIVQIDARQKAIGRYHATSE